MMEKIIIQKKNEVFFHVKCDVGVGFEISEYFKYRPKDYRFMPKFKSGIWDGWIRMFNPLSSQLHIGLYPHLKEFCDAREYSLEFQVSDTYGLPNTTENISFDDVVEFTSSLDLTSGGSKIELRDYQLNAVYNSLTNKRNVILSPTASGKSSIIYTLSRYWEQQDKRVLITVPNVSLVNQLFADFKDYASVSKWDVDEKVHMIYSGKEKYSDKEIVITTWQSTMHMMPKYFQSFDAVIVDECHTAKSVEMTKLMERLTEAEYRVGLTGSLDDSLTHKTMIQAHFGPIIRVADTRTLIDQGHLADIEIKAILLNYSDETKTTLKGKNKKIDYNDEIDFLIKHERRNKFIRNLVSSLDGNTLVLFNFVERHGEVLYKMIRDKNPERKVFFVHGGVDATDREEIRHILESSKNAIVVASFGTFSTGINVKQLHNVVCASPTKSTIRVLQSIGRGLRKAKNKDKFTWYDIGDKLSKSKSKTSANHTLKQFAERLNIYLKESFEYKIVEVEIE